MSVDALSKTSISMMFLNNSLQMDVSCPENYHGSNFYTCQVDLVPGQRVDLKLVYQPTGIKNDILIRFWTDTIIPYQSAFIPTYRNTYPFNPDEFEGAAYRVWYTCVQTEGEIIITDCQGKISKKFDAQQYLPVQYVADQPAFIFAPFFCDNQGMTDSCISGSENKYDVQFVGGLFTFAQSFFCRPGVGPINSNCTNQDSYGDYYCNRDQLPYKRGPFGQIPDCLQRGFLAYDLPNRSYYCVCYHGYSGVSCEQQDR
uniref:EGF-like domain-containing protein n=2 Tax=Caenorhabditis tropicalis TaxID=1561998 RepID=A0A1I7TLK5_9PELO